MEAEKQNTKIDIFSFMKNLKISKKRLYLLTGILAIVLVLIIAGSYLVYQRLILKPDNKGLSELELREKANKKYIELRGVSYEEENSVRSSLEDAMSAGSTKANNSEKNLAISSAQKIKDKAINSNSDVYYYEIEVTLNKEIDDNNSFIMPYYFDVKSKNFDKNKPVSIKTWTGACSGKNISSQNSKFINYSSFYNNGNLNYLGGKYAVKVNYTDANLGLGCIDSMISTNPDLEFVKAILSGDLNFTKLGNEIVNGVSTAVYEQKVNSAMPLMEIFSQNLKTNSLPATQNAKVRFYLDVDKFQILKREYFTNNDLVYTERLISSKNLGKDGQNEITNYSDLKGVEIREVKQDLTTVYVNKDTKLTDGLKKMPILYPSTDETISGLYFYDQQPQDEYSKLTQTSDFDPIWDSRQKQTEYTQPYANYYGSGFSMSVYKTEPNSNTQNLKKVAKEITIDGKKVNANLLQYSAPDLNSTSGQQTLIAPADLSTVEFQYQGFWYDINFYGFKTIDSINPNAQNIDLLTLTIEKANKIDQRNDFIKASEPQINYNENLKNIKQDSRYLPGDLSKEYNLNATALFVDKTPDKTSTCTQINENERSFAVGDCLVDNFNGFEITFSQQYERGKDELPVSGNESSSSMPSFAGVDTSYFVLKAKYSDMEKYLKNLSNDFAYKEVNGYTLIFAGGNLSQSQRKTIIDNVKVDKDLDLLNTQLTQSTKIPVIDQYRGL